jgi:hypothetical protein
MNDPAVLLGLAFVAGVLAEKFDAARERRRRQRKGLSND